MTYTIINNLSHLDAVKASAALRRYARHPGDDRARFGYGC